MKRYLPGARAAFAVVVLSGLTVSASAGFHGPLIHVEAWNSIGWGSFDVGLNQFNYNSTTDTYSWNMNSPVSLLTAEGVEIATINSMNAFFKQDPIIGLGFVASSGGANTHFVIQSALLSFSTINPAEGQASSGTSVTDFDGDGASFTGNLGGNAYGAYYNGFLNNLFTSQIGSYNVGANLTDTRNAAFGFAGMGSVSDMSAQWDFNLSAFDMASGTSRYEVRPVPEPVSMVVLGLGVLALRRRKK
jgi:hypothetical protein